MNTIKDFTDLRVWQSAHQLAILLYKTRAPFPKEEVFGLAGQLRRAGVSVSSNITEGFGRNFSKEKVLFYHIAQSSLREVYSQVLLAKDIGYVPEQNTQLIFEQIVSIGKMLTALIKTVSSRPIS
ncbi:four helix bundle protein [Candidatus Campbellbacteria bacterium]|nr:MAG: four helix bundle protein [Candidatus Campbellbacteria bacterium]